MTEPREVNVTLTAQVDGYVAAMDRASEATQRVNEALAETATIAKDLLACGIKREDLADAIKGVRQLSEAAALTDTDALNIVVKAVSDFKLTGPTATYLTVNVLTAPAD